jgi:hypothetical protein
LCVSGRVIEEEEEEEEEEKKKEWSFSERYFVC